ncbi:MAG: hypothetical protein MJ124_04890 [Lachnospiraceae bacterium]|nr:hypothetical protein [Lachnospiraceae bacterium]
MKVCVCKHCGMIFQSSFQKYCCDKCVDIDNEIFSQIEEYLRKYPNSNAMQIAEGIGISAMEVVSYIDEGRLIMNNGSFKRL